MTLFHNLSRNSQNVHHKTRQLATALNEMLILVTLNPNTCIF